MSVSVYQSHGYGVLVSPTYTIENVIITGVIIFVIYGYFMDHDKVRGSKLKEIFTTHEAIAAGMN